MVVKVSEVLKDAGLEESEDVIAAALAEHLEAFDRAMVVKAAYSARDEQLLAAGGLDVRVAPAHEIDNWKIGSVNSFMGLISASLTVADTANILGVDSSRIRQRLSDGTLFGFKVRRQWRIPRWQFPGGVELHELGHALSGLTVKDPLSVSTFFTTPNDDLPVNGEPTAPVDWLEQGRPADAVRELVMGLAVS